jgi:phosphopantothenoylcysteine decarboxylase/phosphopantothenate--cysteine ligase
MSMNNPVLSSLNNKRILLGITGGIAAYKSAELVRQLRQAGAQVQVVMTAAAKEFITPLTLQALSGNKVRHELLSEEHEAAMGHIELARWPDLIVIAPASADFLARLAYGFANDLLTTLCLATAAPLLIVPAMNQQMWRNPATQANIEILKQRKITLLGPASGEQACGDVGPGRMVEPSAILEQMAVFFQADYLSGKKILITAGPTREPIDPVRYISNLSSGKMGYAIAQAAREAGAEVSLISGPSHLSPPANIDFCAVTTAQEMYDAVMSKINGQDIFIAAAAVSDYSVTTPAAQKIKKTAEILTLELHRNIDILAAVAALPNRPFTVGFAAETENVAVYAKKKLQEKNLDMIVANQVGKGKGFETDENALTIITSQQEIELEFASKIKLARQLIAIIGESILSSRA